MQRGVQILLPVIPLVLIMEAQSLLQPGHTTVLRHSNSKEAVQMVRPIQSLLQIVQIQTVR